MSELLWGVSVAAAEDADAALMSSLRDPLPGRVLAKERDRRAGSSPLTHASHVLAHAAEHLVREQMAGRGGAAVREAIGLLCEAGERVLETERRVAGKLQMAYWIRGAQASRAKRTRVWW